MDWRTALLALCLVLYADGFSKYGRTCKDIGCLNSEVCVLAEDPCSFGRTSQCGTYPTCKKKSKVEGSHAEPAAPLPKPSAPRDSDNSPPNYPPPNPPNHGVNTYNGGSPYSNGGGSPYGGSSNGGGSPYGGNSPYGGSSNGGGSPYGGNSPYGSSSNGGGSPYGGNSPYGGSNSGGGSPYGGSNGGSSPYGGNTNGGGSPYDRNPYGGNTNGGGSPYNKSPYGGSPYGGNTNGGGSPYGGSSNRGGSNPYGGGSPYGGSSSGGSGSGGSHGSPLDSILSTLNKYANSGGGGSSGGGSSSGSGLSNIFGSILGGLSKSGGVNGLLNTRPIQENPNYSSYSSNSKSSNPQTYPAGYQPNSQQTYQNRNYGQANTQHRGGATTHKPVSYGWNVGVSVVLTYLIQQYIQSMIRL